MVHLELEPGNDALGPLGLVLERDHADVLPAHERIFIELMMSDRGIKESREPWK